MKTFKYEIKDALGIHARPAGLLVKETKKFQSTITIEKEGKTAEATRVMAVMAMGVKAGDTIKVTANGLDEDVAIKSLESFFQEKL